MNNSYVIQWKSKVNGRAGKGTKRFQKEEAEQLVQELNREYPQIEHHAVPMDESQPASEKTPAPDAAPTPISIV